jgi:hypothetical protein
MPVFGSVMSQLKTLMQCVIWATSPDKLKEEWKLPLNFSGFRLFTIRLHQGVAAGARALTAGCSI